MKENNYDNPEFFSQYRRFPRSVEGLSAAGEWHALQKLFPAFSGKRVLDLGCGFGWHCRYAADPGAAAVIGLLTGGFFSDFLAQSTGMLGLPQPAVPFLSVPEGSGLPAPLLNVMEDPMTVLVFALAVGFVQIVVGMAG